MKSLARSLVLHGKIKTTEAKAKEIRPYVEKLVTKGMKETLATKRILESTVGPKAAKKITSELSPEYKDRKGGYTRITKMVRRSSDGSPMAVIEFVK
jgi:large subunit ribosomal protein L17